MIAIDNYKLVVKNSIKMKKKYLNPIIRLHVVRSSNIIVTSDVPIGDDVNETSTEAPRHNGEWSEYEG